MKIEELDFDYPKELVAFAPASPRESARLLVFNRKTKKIQHTSFEKIGDYLIPGDILVLNKTKVFPARVFGFNSQDKKIEILFLNELAPKKWEVLIGGRVSDGEMIKIGPDFFGILRKGQAQNCLEVNLSKEGVLSFLEASGHVPLPPYIKREDEKGDKKEYQTVFAKEVGSAAAPTAGLHFSKKLLRSLKDQGIMIEYVTLHVGLGTFAPVKVERVEDHPIHSEYYEIDKKTATALNEAKKEGRRIIACGTTTVRALESASDGGLIKPQKTETKLFITPGYKFKTVDGLITNFHTPRSSLLALVYAFAGQENIRDLYGLAIEEKYRLFSYGDGMLLI